MDALCDDSKFIRTIYYCTLHSPSFKGEKTGRIQMAQCYSEKERTADSSEFTTLYMTCFQVVSHGGATRCNLTFGIDE